MPTELWDRNENINLFPILRNDEQIQPKESHKKVSFNLPGDEDSDGEDMEEIFGGKATSLGKFESKSSFEKRQEKVKTKLLDCELVFS